MNEIRGPNGERVEVVQPLTPQHVKLLRTSAERGSASAQYKLGLQHLSGMYVDQNFELAAALFRMAAEQGNPDAQEYLSQCYTRGQGVAQNVALGMKWAREAADQGSLQSQFNVGEAFAKGALQGIPFDDSGGEAPDYALAAKYYRMAASQGRGLWRTSTRLTFNLLLLILLRACVRMTLAQQVSHAAPISVHL